MTCETCTYPECNCPFDMGSDSKCLRGYPMKDAVNTAIDFTKENFAKINTGKRTAIRLGRKDLRLGGIDFTVEGLSCEETPVVTDVRFTRFNKLTVQDALNDGFNCLDQLRQELQECYGRRISDFDEVTVIKFEV